MEGEQTDRATVLAANNDWNCFMRPNGVSTFAPQRETVNRFAQCTYVFIHSGNTEGRKWQEKGQIERQTGHQAAAGIVACARTASVLACPLGRQ